MIWCPYSSASALRVLGQGEDVFFLVHGSAVRIGKYSFIRSWGTTLLFGREWGDDVHIE